jgi:hypothetical protein
MQATVDNLCRTGQACRRAADKISGDQQSYQRPADAIAIERGDYRECKSARTFVTLTSAVVAAPNLSARALSADQDLGAGEVTMREWIVLALEILRLAGSRAVASAPRLSNGSCQCLFTILSIFSDGCFGSVVGNPISMDLTDLTSGAASLMYVTWSLSAFVNVSLWTFVPVVMFSDESATLSVGVVSRETSAFAEVTP